MIFVALPKSKIVSPSKILQTSATIETYAKAIQRKVNEAPGTFVTPHNSKITSAFIDI